MTLRTELDTKVFLLMETALVFIIMKKTFLRSHRRQLLAAPAQSHVSLAVLCDELRKEEAEGARDH
jgi:hypothetical protein